MTVFALVHGAWQGAWCWKRLIPELEQRGHTAVGGHWPMISRPAQLADLLVEVAGAP